MEHIIDSMPFNWTLLLTIIGEFFMTLLLFPLLSAILSFEMGDIAFGIVCVVAFVLAIVFFSFFIMGDKKEFKETVFVNEGLWERATLLCMYLPFVYHSMDKILG